MLQVVNYSKEQSKQWDDYVQSNEQGSFFHLSAWAALITESFGHKCHYLYALEGDSIVGVLPLVEVKSLLFGHALVSTPFCVYGGTLGNSSEIVAALESKAVALAEKLQVDHLELRYKTKQQSNLQLVQHHATFITPITAEQDENLAAIKKKQRAVIRHSLKANMDYENCDLDSFYNLLSISYRNLGTPIMGKKYFNNLVKAFAHNVSIKKVCDTNGKEQCAVLNFYFKQQVLPYYAGGKVDAKRNKSMDFMYFQLMCESGSNGFTEFDFGRSKNDSGAYKYKEHWGIKPQPLYYYYHLVKASKLPNLSPANPKYSLLINLWRKLPLTISQFIGPYLSKSLG